MALLLSFLLLVSLYAKNKLAYQNLFKSLIDKKYLAVLSILFLVSFYFVQIRPYLKLFGSLPSQDWNETFQYSAKISSILNASLYSMIYQPIETNWGHWERTYFPGFLLLIVSIFSLVRFYMLKANKNNDLLHLTSLAAL
jgi:hypothetical protein